MQQVGLKPVFAFGLVRIHAHLLCAALQLIDDINVVRAGFQSLENSVRDGFEPLWNSAQLRKQSLFDFACEKSPLRRVSSRRWQNTAWNDAAQFPGLQIGRFAINELDGRRLAEQQQARVSTDVCENLLMSERHDLLQ